MATKLFDIDVCLPELWRLIKLQLDTKQGTLVAGRGIVIEDDGTISVTLDTTIFKFVTTLPDKPDEGDENKIFVVKSAQGETGNEYTEYYWTGSEWEKLGEFKADVDLSDYYTKEEVDSKISEVNSTIESTKTELESSISQSAETAQSNLESAVSQLESSISQTAQTAQSNLESSVSELESSISDTASTAQTNLESAVSELEEKISESESKTTYSAGDNISISNDNKISTSGVYTSTETDTAISEAIDGLKSEVESELSNIQSSLDSVASDIPSVVEGYNISVTHTGTVYTVSTSGVYTSSEVDTLIGNATSTLESALESAKSELESEISDVSSEVPSVEGGTNITVSKSGTVYTVSAPNVYTQADVDAALAKKQDLLTAGTGISIVDNVVTCTLDTTIYTVVTELPAKGDENRIYLLYVPDAVTEGSMFDEYIWINSTWVKIGEHTTEVDLSDYYTKSETDTAINKVTESLTDYLPLKGGTMSGDIVIGSSGTTIRCSDGHIVLSSGIELY